MHKKHFCNRSLTMQQKLCSVQLYFKSKLVESYMCLMTESENTFYKFLHSTYSKIGQNKLLVSHQLTHTRVLGLFA